MARLTPEQHDEIIEKYKTKDGPSAQELAAEYGVTHQAIFQLFERRNITPKTKGKKVHGSNRGYQRHLRNGTEPCERCLSAHATYVRAERRKKSAARKKMYRDTAYAKEKAARELEKAASVDAEKVVLALRDDRRIVE